MDERCLKLPRWARDTITALENDNRSLRKAITTLPDPNAAIIANAFNENSQRGFDQFAVMRFNMGNDRHIDVHHHGSFVKVFGNRPLILKPRSSNHFETEVE
jgi:hypothetical protein